MEEFADKPAADLYSYIQFRRYLKKIIYLGFEKSQCIVTHDTLRYKIFILTNLLIY